MARIPIREVGCGHHFFDSAVGILSLTGHTVSHRLLNYAFDCDSTLVQHSRTKQLTDRGRLTDSTVCKLAIALYDSPQELIRAHQILDALLFLFRKCDTWMPSLERAHIHLSARACSHYDQGQTYYEVLHSY